MRSVVWRSFLAGGVEVGDDAFGPVFGGIVDGSGALPQVFAHSGLERLFDFLAEFGVQSFDSKFVLLDVAAAVVPVGIHRSIAANIIECLGKFTNDLAFT